MRNAGKTFVATAIVAAIGLVSASFAGAGPSDPTDETPPVIASASPDKSTVDVSGGPQTVTFTAHISDNPAGVASASLHVTDPSDAKPINAAFTRTAGDAHDGTYTASITVPASAAEGWWNCSMTATDANGNTTPDWGAACFRVGSGPADTTPPVFASTSVDRSTLTPSASAQLVTFGARITDDDSGVWDGGVDVLDPNGVARSSAHFVRDSGDDADGHYTAEVSVPPDAALGQWKCLGWAIDNALNTRDNVELPCFTVAQPRRPTHLDATPIVITPALLGLAGPSLSAHLTSAGAPVAGKTVIFRAGEQAVCVAVTGADGVAACGSLGTAVNGVLALGYTAEFMGDAEYTPAFATGPLV